MTDSTRAAFEAKLRELLKGIDSDDSTHPDSWLETSSGSKFGAEKLRGVLALMGELRRATLLEAAKVCDEQAEGWEFLGHRN